MWLVFGRARDTLARKFKTFPRLSLRLSASSNFITGKQISTKQGTISCSEYFNT